MSFEIFFQKNKDEMDFIPIIPLNESDSENMDGIEIPDEISLLPLQYGPFPWSRFANNCRSR